MISKPKRVITKTLVCFSLLLILGCNPSPRFYLQYEGRLTESGLDQVLAENPLPPTQNIRVSTLGYQHIF